MHKKDYFTFPGKVFVRTLLVLMLLVSLEACKNDKESAPVQNLKPESQNTAVLPIRQNENKDRDIWQKPSIVIDLLGDLSEKTVADIGAGTGYFTFRIALKAKKVIAIDIEARFLDIINTFKRNLPGEVQDRIETRLAKPNNPLLAEEEVDLIVIINTIGEISNRKAYLKTLLPALKPGGTLVILDYKMKKLPMENAPPQKDRVPLNVLEKDLASIGYSDIQSNDTSLDYQYIIFAIKP